MQKTETLIRRETPRTREAAADQSRKVRGYAILFNTPSVVLWEEGKAEAREVIAPEAVTMEFLDRQDIKMTMYHNRELILARSQRGKGSLSYGVDERGVWFEFDAPESPNGDEALSLVSRADVAGCSFMFSTYYDDPDYVERTQDEDKSVTYTVRKMTGIYDFTLAADPAYPKTEVHAEPKPEEPDKGNEDTEDSGNREMTAEAARQIRQMRHAASAMTRM